MTVTTLGAFPGANDKDKSQRIPAAIRALNAALAGDASQLAYMQAQSVGSATAVGKDAFRRALAIYATQKPTPTATPVQAPTVVHLAPTTQPVIIQAPKPPIVPTVDTHGAQAMPLGFDPTFHTMPALPPVAFHPSVTVSGVAPGIIQPVILGTQPVDGGVITGQPQATDYAAPQPSTSSFVDDSTPAPAVKADGTPADVPASAKSGGVGIGAPLILGLGVLLWLLVDGSLINHKGRNA